MNPFLVLKQKDKLQSKRIKLESEITPLVPQISPLRIVVPQISPLPIVVPLVPTVPKPLYVNNILKILTEYVQGNPTKVLVFEGHPGIGKSYVLEYFAQQHDYILDIYDDDTDILEFLLNDNLNKKKRIPIIDYIESFDLTVIHKHIDQLIKQHTVITTLNVYDSNLYKWKGQIEIVRFRNYTTKELSTILNTTNQQLLEQCKGDLRYGQLMQKYAFKYTNQDNYYDLFGTSRNGILHCNISGVQSKDLFLLMTMLQQNSSSWSLNLSKSLDAFCNIDLQERELPSENLCDYLNCILEAFSCRKTSIITMPKIPNTIKMSKCLRLAVPLVPNVVEQHDTLNCIRDLVPAKITKSSEYYHENADVRQLIKISPFKLF